MIPAMAKSRASATATGLEVVFGCDAWAGKVGGGVGLPTRDALDRRRRILDDGFFFFFCFIYHPAATVILTFSEATLSSYSLPCSSGDRLAVVVSACAIPALPTKRS